MVKQRMQIGHFASAPSAVRLIISNEGFKGLYAVITAYISLRKHSILVTDTGFQSAWWLFGSICLSKESRIQHGFVLVALLDQCRDMDHFYYEICLSMLSSFAYMSSSVLAISVRYDLHLNLFSYPSVEEHISLFLIINGASLKTWSSSS